MRLEFLKRRDYIVKRINAIPGVSCINPNGAFYVMMNIEQLIGHTLGGRLIENDDDFAVALLEKALVAVVPCSGFGAKNFVRWSYAASMENIEKGLDRLEKFINEWYRGILKAEIERVLPKWEQITGLHPDGWQTKNMTTRWGTCNTKTRKIWLNLQLAKKTPECLEYVILHELVHLVEKGHNENFVAWMDRFMPNWRDVRKNLNNQILDYLDFASAEE